MSVFVLVFVFVLWDENNTLRPSNKIAVTIFIGCKIKEHYANFTILIERKISPPKNRVLFRREFFGVGEDD